MELQVEALHKREPFKNAGLNSRSPRELAPHRARGGSHADDATLYAAALTVQVEFGCHRLVVDPEGGRELLVVAELFERSRLREILSRQGGLEGAAGVHSRAHPRDHDH